MKRKLLEGEDYSILPDGRLVFTASYLKERGYCCGNGCMNCPYEYKNVPGERRRILLRDQNAPGSEDKKE